LKYESCLNVNLHQVGIFEDKNFLSSFENEKYDLIIVNGVLEWVGSGISKGNPEKFQKQFLDTCNQKLKNDGLLYLAIENRFYPGWFKRDPHSKLPLTAIAPRSIANLISLVITRKPYRTFIHGFRSLSKIMKKSGFILNTKFYVFHSYRSPTVLFHDNQDYVRELLKEISPNFFSTKWRYFLKFGIKFNLIDLFIPTFTHVYGKKSKANLAIKYKFAFIQNGILEFWTWKK
jgi:SAM-dependent methyltransferase